MKIHYALLLAAMLFVPLAAQTTNAPAGTAPSEGKHGRFGFLTPDERQHLTKVRKQVLAAHPELQKEQEELQKEREDLKSQGEDASPEDRQALFQKSMEHGQKMNDAMAQADPTVKPIIEKLKAKMKERFQKRAGGAGNDAGGNQ